MTEAAIADHGLDPHEGELRGPRSRNRSCRGRRAGARTSRRSSSSTEAVCWIRRCCECRASVRLSPRPDVGLYLAARDGELISASLGLPVRPAASHDGLQGCEGTFSLCSFFYIVALAPGGPTGGRARVERC